MRIVPIVLVLFLPAVVSAQQVDPGVRLVTPAVLSRLPPIIRADLVARDCLIPQGTADSAISAIRGDFQNPGQVDWAILCVQGARTHILLYYNNDGAAGDSLPAKRNHLIKVAGPPSIIEHLQRYSEDTSLVAKGDSLKLAIMHDGIEESDTVCCSTIHFWQAGKWVEYPGAQ